MNYRKVYENHFGPIPKDKTGRTYDIHHIDGDRSNNSLENLKAVTIQEHYDIHYLQKDYAACIRIASKMKLDPKEISNLARKNANQRVENGTNPFLNKERTRKITLSRIADGTHNFLGPENNLKRVMNGTHPFLGGKIQKRSAQVRLANGTHNFLGENNPSHKRFTNGTHNFQVENYGRKLAQKRKDNKTDFFSINNPAKTIVSCPYCNKTGSLPAMTRWHFDNCKGK